MAQYWQVEAQTKTKRAATVLAGFVGMGTAGGRLYKKKVGRVLWANLALYFSIRGNLGGKKRKPLIRGSNRDMGVRLEDVVYGF